MPRIFEILEPSLTDLRLLCSWDFRIQFAVVGHVVGKVGIICLLLEMAALGGCLEVEWLVPAVTF